MGMTVVLVTFAVAAAIGGLMAWARLRRRDRQNPPPLVAVAHGLIALAAIVGLGWLALAEGIQGQNDRDPVAFALAVVVALLGILLAVTHVVRRRQLIPAPLLGAHAALALYLIVLLLIALV